MLGAEMFLKEKEVSVMGYEWYSRNRDSDKQASRGVAVLVHKSLDSRVRKSRGAGVD